jgi:hypothetical protein
MAATLFSAVVTCVASLFIGQAALRLAGARVELAGAARRHVDSDAHRHAGDGRSRSQCHGGGAGGSFSGLWPVRRLVSPVSTTPRPLTSVGWSECLAAL